ncbi:MAG: tRNA (adenosine(37)-N6)-threonylcarbamoyltransferase complex dimerization subunit type 1 TsaB [Planctomycetota bacterium]
MRILGVDTSSPATSLALLEDGEVAAEYHVRHDHPPSDAVFGLLEGLLRPRGITVADCDAFAVCVGPGSFTGLRIGLGMAKTFAWALGRPIHGFDSVELLAARALRQGAVAEGETFDALFTALRGSVFAGTFEVSSGVAVRRGDLRYADDLAGELAVRDASRPLVALDGEALPPSLAPRRLALDPSAAILAAELAAGAIAEGRPADLDAVQPTYLKPFSVGRPARTRSDET